MAERVILTSAQAKALQQLRANHRTDSCWSDETEWVPVDEETRPHKMPYSAEHRRNNITSTADTRSIAQLRD